MTNSSWRTAAFLYEVMVSLQGSHPKLVERWFGEFSTSLVDLEPNLRIQDVGVWGNAGALVSRQRELLERIWADIVEGGHLDGEALSQANAPNENLEKLLTAFVPYTDDLGRVSGGLGFEVRLLDTRPAFSVRRDPGLFALFRYVASARIGDWVLRETHGAWGYHFHYCVGKRGKEKRTNVILSWDPAGEEVAEKPPLFWEAHAEGKKKVKSARPGAFGAGRKEDLYNACVVGTGKIRVVDFKQPSSDSTQLWPPLTPTEILSRL